MRPSQQPVAPIRPASRGPTPVSGAVALQRLIVFLYAASLPFGYWRVEGFGKLTPPTSGVGGVPHLAEATTILMVAWLAVTRSRDLASALKSRAAVLWLAFAAWATVGYFFSPYSRMDLFWETPGQFRICVVSMGLALLAGLTLARIPGCPDALAAGLISGCTILCVSVVRPELFPESWVARGVMMTHEGRLLGYRPAGLFSGPSGGGGGTAAQFTEYGLACLLGCRPGLLRRRWYFLGPLFMFWLYALSQSYVRGCVLAVLVAIALWLVDRVVEQAGRRQGRGLFVGLAFLAAAAVTYEIVAKSPTMARAEAFGGIEKSVQHSRLSQWARTGEDILANPGVLLVGAGIGRGDNPHNFLLFFLQGSGVLGVVLVIRLLSLNFISLRRIGSVPPRTGILDGSFSGRYMVTAMLVDASFGGMLHLLAPGMLAMLVMGGLAIPQNELRKVAVTGCGGETPRGNL